MTIFTKDEWEKIRREQLPVYSFIKESRDSRIRTDFVFAYTMGQDDFGFAGFPDIPTTQDEQYKGPFYDVQNVIIPSFKLGTEH
jgi:hypothetical protein